MRVKARSRIRIVLAGCMALLGAVHAQAQTPAEPTIIDTWKEVATPPPPSLAPVSVDAAHGALLIFDVLAVNCVPEKRPSCVRTVPHIRHLLDMARARHMLVVYSAGLPSSPVPPDPVAALAPQAGEPMVRASVDKFVGSNLEQILRDHHIDTVIVTGTSAEGAVLYAASGAALRGMKAVVPVDGMSAVQPFAELYTAWHLKNAPAALSSHVVLTRSDMISIP